MLKVRRIGHEVNMQMYACVVQLKQIRVKLVSLVRCKFSINVKARIESSDADKMSSINGKVKFSNVQFISQRKVFYLVSLRNIPPAVLGYKAVTRICPRRGGGLNLTLLFPFSLLRLSVPPLHFPFLPCPSMFPLQIQLSSPPFRSRTP